jgi:hypothetical protein
MIKKKIDWELLSQFSATLKNEHFRLRNEIFHARNQFSHRSSQFDGVGSESDQGSSECLLQGTKDCCNS